MDEGPEEAVEQRGSGAATSSDATDRLRELVEQTGVLSRKNTHLANALRAARQELAALHRGRQGSSAPTPGARHGPGRGRHRTHR